MSRLLPALRRAARLAASAAFWYTAALALLVPMVLDGTVAPEGLGAAALGFGLPFCAAGMGAQALAAGSAGPGLRRALPHFRRAQLHFTAAFWAAAAAVFQVFA
ncbi:MAG TPA: hypothetical protein VEB20_08620 [Azospirillaceae bacterium]|nr:hypothetical protein [Azospirillaceae bacterium]